MLRMAALVCLLLGPSAALAQIRYISDNIPVTLRTGASVEYRILRNMPAGLRVEVIGVDAENGYSRVRVVDDGTEGWVLTRYLQSEPVARERLAGIERNLAAARQRAAELENQVAMLTEELARVRSEREATAPIDLPDELRDVRAAAPEGIGTREQNEQLRRRLAEAEERISRLAMENTELASDARQSWFLAGAGVLIAGVVLGLVAPNFRRKRRSSW